MKIMTKHIPKFNLTGRFLHSSSESESIDLGLYRNISTDTYIKDNIIIEYSIDLIDQDRWGYRIPYKSSSDRDKDLKALKEYNKGCAEIKLIFTKSEHAHVKNK